MRRWLAALTALALCVATAAAASDWSQVPLPEDVKVWDMGAEVATLWFTTQGAGLLGYDGATWVIHEQSDGGIRNDNWNYGLLVASNGDKWVTRDGTSTLDRLDDGGTFSFKEDDVWSYYNYPDQLANKRVFSSAEDSEGRCWFGMRDENLSRLGVLELFIDNSDTTTADDEWFHYDNVWTPDSTDFRGDDVRALMVDDDDRLWIGYYGSGIDVWEYGNPRTFADDSWTHYAEEEGLPEDDVHTFWQAADGTIWAGTLGGLAALDEASGTWTTIQGLPGTQARAVSEDAQGHIWVGTNGGVAMLYANRTVAFTYTTEDGLAEDLVEELIVDASSGNVWALTKDSVADATTLNLFRSGIVEGSGLLFVYPNPWREGVSEGRIQIYGAPEGSIVEVYDITGQKVAELPQAEPFIWDSLDDSFNEVPSGVYIIRVEPPGEEAEFLKIAIIR